MMGSLNLLNLVPLTERTSGGPQVKIGLIDGPVERRPPDLAGGRFHELKAQFGAAAGATDEHHALNYLAMRYAAIDAKAAEGFGRDFC
jgi:hypothetical protein